MIKTILHGGMAADTAEPISTKINLAQISGFSPHFGVTNASRMRRRVLARPTGRAVMFPLDPPCWQFRMSFGAFAVSTLRPDQPSPAVAGCQGSISVEEGRWCFSPIADAERKIRSV